MKRWVMVNAATGQVENVILFDDRLVLIQDDGAAAIGGRWDGEQFLPPPVPEELPPAE